MSIWLRKNCSFNQQSVKFSKNNEKITDHEFLLFFLGFLTKDICFQLLLDNQIGLFCQSNSILKTQLRDLVNWVKLVKI